MKVQINRVHLLEALDLLISTVNNKISEPLLRCVQITVTKKAVKICATDSVTNLTYYIPAIKIENTGEVIIPLDKLELIIRNLTDEILTFETHNNTCEIKCTNSSFIIYSYEPKKYPTIPDLDSNTVIQMTLSTIQTGIKQTIFAAAKEATKYMLNGIVLDIEDKALNMVATDGHRLAQYSMKLTDIHHKNKIPKNIIIPIKVMTLIDKICGAVDDILSIKFVDNSIVAVCNNITISSTLLCGDYPAYKKLIPNTHDKTLSLSTTDTISAIINAGILAHKDIKGINIDITKKNIMFISETPEIGKAQISIPIDYSGKSITIGFNIQLLLDILNVIKTPEFELQLGQPNEPCIIKSGIDLLYLLMPMNI